ncbi:hypothetical protein CK203_086057 [Vitis vinifera]|uniref:Uncharacterized protein n=1 Tax=Vitis vinifera TaxID=29760 RepID=A0A438D522_VITVI|nr:hypothetical protein CK203_086057 [Vitis vinifera]
MAWRRVDALLVLVPSQKLEISSRRSFWYGRCRKNRSPEKFAGKFRRRGDFNVIRRSSEKLGGSSLTSSMKDFDSFIRECELLDPPLRNTSFTWSNMQESPECKRLDRFLYSNEWGHLFPQGLQKTLPRRTSDHWPIVLDTNPFKWGPTPFRFKNMWLQHPNFKENFRNWWRGLQGNGREGEEGVVFKIYFEKAYDHVSWDFLDHVLEKKGFSPSWRKWMSGCLSSVSYAVLVNGNTKGWVKASRGLRQGRTAESQKSLLVFGHISRLKVNLDKSDIYGINLDQNHLSRLAELLDCKASGGLYSIWVFLWGGNPKACGFWDPVIERISKKIRWVAKTYLSFGGRITLIQSCLTHMPCYFLSLFKIPASVAAKIERLQRDFYGQGLRKENGCGGTLKRVQLYGISSFGILKSLQSEVLCLVNDTPRRSSFPTLLFDDRVVAQIISVSQDGLGTPEEHL